MAEGGPANDECTPPAPSQKACDNSQAPRLGYYWQSGYDLRPSDSSANPRRHSNGTPEGRPLRSAKASST